jgi:desulfoferrodoxin-like iron-binding protein
MLSIKRKNLLVGVNVARDPENLSVLEQVHLPKIECPKRVRIGQSFPIVVTAGTRRPHPHDRRHFVERVNIYADDILLASVMPPAESSPPRVEIRTSLDHDVETIRAQVRCNLHGTWEAIQPITVDTDR